MRKIVFYVGVLAVVVGLGLGLALYERIAAAYSVGDTIGAR